MGGLARYAAKTGWEHLGLYPLVLPLGPGHLEIEICGRCNLSCVMCPRSLEQDGRIMSPATYRAVLEGAPDVYSVSLGGFGEPLLHPELESIIAETRERRVACSLSTNGMLLDPVRRRLLLAAGLDSVSVSLAGASADGDQRIRRGADFELVVSNLRRLLLERGRSRMLPVVCLSFVCMHSNMDQLPAVLELAEDLGVDELVLKPLHELVAASERERLSCADKARLFGIRAAAEELSVAVRVEPFMGGKPVGAVPCNWPWTRAFVQADGRVSPCAFERDYSFGDGSRPGLRQIWNSGEYREFRQGLISARPPGPCRRHCFGRPEVGSR
jgi:MoaA/NifB/PqqE/SkfB family radical SAM enzyme